MAQRWLVGVCLTGLVGAARGLPPDVRLVPGFDGATRTGAPMALRVDVASTGDPARGELRVAQRVDSFGAPRELYTTAIDVPAGGSKRYWLLLPPQTATVELAAVLRLNDLGRAQLRQPVDLLDSETRLIAVANASRSGLRSLARDTEPLALPPLPGSRRAETLVAPAPRRFRVVNVGFDELPPMVGGYAPLAALVIAGDGFRAVSGETKQAVADWVAGGGRLVLCGGVESAALWADPVVRKLLPVEVRPGGTATLAEFAPLAERFGGRFESRAGRYAVSTLRRTSRPAVTLGSPPMVAEGPYGLGRVVVVAGSFEAPPLRDWSGQRACWAALLGDAAPAEPAPLNLWSALLPAASRLPGDSPPGVAWIIGFVVLYLLVLIPVQFAILRVLDRRELAWLVTPAIVVCFSLGAYAVGARTKGEEVRLQTVGVLHTASGARAGRLISASMLFSPAKHRYDVRLPAGVRWVAELADRVSPGYYGAAPEAVLSDRGQLQVERRDGQSLLPRLSVDMWSGRLFGLDRQVATGPITVTLDPPAAPRRAVVANGTDATLRQVTLVLNGKPRRVSDVAPGRSVTVDLGKASPAPEAIDPPKSESFHEAGLREMTEALTNSDRYEPYRYGAEPALDLEGAALWAWVQTNESPLALGAGRARAVELRLLRVAIPPPAGRTVTMLAETSESQSAARPWPPPGPSPDAPEVVRFTAPWHLAPGRLGALRVSAAATGKPHRLHLFDHRHQKWVAAAVESAEGGRQVWRVPDSIRQFGPERNAYALVSFAEPGDTRLGPLRLTAEERP